MAITRRGAEIQKLAADAKPAATSVQAGTILQNTDDRKRWLNSGTDWIMQTPPAHKEFTIYKEGTTTYIKDEQGKQVSTPGSDTVAVVQPLLNGMANGMVYTLYWDANAWDFETPLLMPSVTAAQATRKVNMIGRGFVGHRNLTGTTALLQPTANFPNQRYLIECPNQGDSTPKTSQVYIDGFLLRNGLTQGTKDVGGILLNGGNLLNGNFNWSVKNIYGNYLWRGLHLQGQIWFGEFENMVFSVSSLGWLGDCVIKMDMGDHSGGVGPCPKECVFKRIHTNSGDGYYNAFMDVRALGYSKFYDFYVDGKFFANAVFYFNNTDYPNGAIAGNTFYNITTLDLENTVPNNQLGNIYMHAGAGRIYDNQIFNFRGVNHSAGALVMDDAGVFRNEVHLVARYGSTPTLVNDTGSGESNTIVVRPGAKIDAGEVAITHTGGVSRIIDMRRGASNSGTQVFTGTGSATQFGWAHGLFQSPAFTTVTPYSAAAAAPFFIGTSGTTITVNYITPPVNAANITLVWRSEVYK